MAPNPASALPFLQLYNRTAADSRKPEALSDHKIGGNDWVHFII
jgi:hypothetical protein